MNICRNKFLGALLGTILLLGVLSSCKTTDLRPEGYVYASNVNKAKQLLSEMGEAHQIGNWDKLETYNVILDAEFYGFLGKQSHAFKEQKIEFSLDFVPKTEDGQMTILSGKEKNETWGVQSGKTYYLDDASKPAVKTNKNMKFYIPTYQYFLEFPSRIQEATSIDYLGTKLVEGVSAEGIIASWGTVATQKDLDQYLIWIDADSKRIIKIEYTVRDKFKFVSSEAYFQDYKDYGGIILPSKMPVKSNLKKDGYISQVSIKDFTPNKVSVSSLRPLTKITN